MAELKNEKDLGRKILTSLTKSLNEELQYHEFKYYHQQREDTKELVATKEK